MPYLASRVFTKQQTENPKLVNCIKAIAHAVTSLQVKSVF